MNARISLTPFAAAVAAAALCGLAPAPARAQAGGVPASVYVEPQIVKLGTATTPAPGKGTVIVQVLVKADGTFEVKRIISSTNPANNAAALEIAKSSTYKAATNHGKPQLAFKDFTLNFTGTGASLGGGASEIDRMNALLKANDYAGAKSAAQSYLGAHPADPQASTVLGVANSYLGDDAAAVAAFDNVATIPPAYTHVAAASYISNAGSLNKSKQYDASIASSKRAIALVPSPAAYYTLGIAESGKGDPVSAVRDLEQSNTLAASDSAITPAQHATILGGLAGAYAATGAFDKAKTTVDQAKQLDPNADPGVPVANVLISRAIDEDKAKNYSAAAADFIQAAAFAPSKGAALYTEASFAYLKVNPKPDNDKARDAANKALAIDPKDASASYALGVAYANDGKRDDARKALNTALKQANDANDTALAASINNVLKQLAAQQ